MPHIHDQPLIFAFWMLGIHAWKGNDLIVIQKQLLSVMHFVSYAFLMLVTCFVAYR